MALNDNAVLAINSGNYFTAPVDTPLPDDLTAPEVDWTNVGHTSLEEILSFDVEGGEKTILGTLQNKQLRTRTSPKTQTINITLRQFDEDSLKLYHGSNAEVLANGLVTSPTEPVPTSAAFLAVYVDADNIFALYIPKAEILGSDSMVAEDTESFAGLPLGVTPLVSGSNKWAYAVTPLGAVTP